MSVLLMIVPPVTETGLEGVTFRISARRAAPRKRLHGGRRARTRRGSVKQRLLLAIAPRDPSTDDPRHRPKRVHNEPVVPEQRRGSGPCLPRTAS